MKLFTHDADLSTHYAARCADAVTRAIIESYAMTAAGESLI